jgi:hypothetical protein
VQLLAERVAIDLDGLRRKIRTALEKTEGAVSLEGFDVGLLEGVLSPDDARAALEAAGVARDTALVYVRLVLTTGFTG